MTETNEIVIARPETESLTEEAGVLVVKAEAVTIETRQDHAETLIFIKELRSRERAITEHFEPSRAALESAKKEILSARDSLVKPLAEARGILNSKATGYEDEQERIAREAQRKAEEEERKKAEEARKAEEERLAALEEALDEGEIEKAEEIMAADPEPEPEVVHVPVVPDVAKVEGVSSHKRYSAEVVDKMLLIRYVAEHPEWESLIEPNIPALNRIAISQKDEMKLPGVKAVAKTVRSTR